MKIEEREHRRARGLPPEEDVASRLETLAMLLASAKRRATKLGEKRLSAELDEAKTLVAVLRDDLAYGRKGRT